MFGLKYFTVGTGNIVDRFNICEGVIVGEVLLNGMYKLPSIQLSLMDIPK